MVLRWALQRGYSVIPKSGQEERIKENMDLFSFSLTEEDMADIPGTSTNTNTNTNPEMVPPGKLCCTKTKRYVLPGTSHKVSSPLVDELM